MAAVTAAAAVASTILAYKGYKDEKKAVKQAKAEEKQRLAEMEAQRLERQKAEEKAKVRGVSAGYISKYYTRSSFLDALKPANSVTGFPNVSSGGSSVSRTSVFGN